MAPDTGSNELGLARLAAFLMACRAADPDGDYRHPGDLCWHFRNEVDVVRDVRLWEDGAGDLLGFALVDPADGTLWTQLRPDARDALDEPALGWGFERLRASAPAVQGTGRVLVSAREDDAARVACLTRQGFTPLVHGFVDLWRALDRPIPDPPLPPGYAMRAMRGPEEIDAYVALHRDAWSRWGPSGFTAAAHRRLARTPGYRWDLHPVVVAPDGALASSCIGWLDPVNRIGEIEPLGTRRDHARRGLARAVVAEALRLMRAHGMATVLVHGAEVNAPARALYASLGFTPGRRGLTFARPL